MGTQCLTSIIIRRKISDTDIATQMVPWDPTSLDHRPTHIFGIRLVAIIRILDISSIPILITYMVMFVASVDGLRVYPVSLVITHHQ
jgi:hypothetical protein